MIHNVSPDIEEYFLQQYEKQDMRVVPGHWLEMNTKQDVDKWIEGLNAMKKVFACFEKEREAE